MNPNNLLALESKKNLGRIEQKYTTDEGVSKKFFEYKSSYDYKTKDINKTGLSYNAFVTMLKEEDNYDTEYLVTENFLKKSLKEKCNMDLVESASFYDIYKQKNSFFDEVAPKEENKNSKNYFMKISEFYNQEDSVNKASLEFCKLHRYYVFKKRAGSKSRVVTKEAVKTKKVSKKTSKRSSRKTKEPSKKKNSRKSRETIKVKKPSKKNNLIDKYLNSSNVLDI